MPDLESSKPMQAQLTPDVADPSSQIDDERFRILLDAVGNGYGFYSAEGTLLHCSQDYASILGTSPVALVGRPLFHLVHPDDQPLVQANFAQLAQTPGHRTELEFRLVRDQRTPVWVGATLVNQLDHPAVQAIIVSMRDISKRKSTQSALMESERRHATLLANLPGMAYRCDNSPAWTMEFVSEGCAALTGYLPDDFVNGTPRTYVNLIHPDDQAAVWRDVQAAIEARTPFTLNYRIITADGSVRWVTERGQAVYSATGEVEALEGFVFDVNDLREAEQERNQFAQEFARQAKRLEQIVHNIPDGMLLLDHLGTLILANPRAFEDLALLGAVHVGEPLTQLGGLTLEQLLAPPPKGLQHEVTGGDRTFQVLAHPVTDPFSPGGWVLVLRDVTRERAIQHHMEEQARLAAIGQLAAGIAHDFNNILAVIGLYAEMGQSTPNLPSSLDERLEIIVQQTKRATHLIRQLLDFSRRTYLERHPLDLGPFMEDFVSLLRHTLPESIAVDVTFQPDDYLVDADPRQLEQALMNLALNARDALSTGGRIHFKLSSLEFQTPEQSPLSGLEPGVWVCIAIHDNGMGILAQDLAHIFEPFFTTKEPGKGSGLGLAQVHGIVKQHDGEIHVISQPGRGTTFYIYLPALVTVHAAPVEEPNPLDLPYGTGQRLLLVEDDAATRRALGAALKFLNYHVDQAKDGETALGLLQEAAVLYDLVITDLIMPDLGGRDLLEILNVQFPDLPVIVLSGHALSELHEAKRDDLPHPWLVKPPSLEALAYVVAQSLDLLP